jgi:hypothetical protein
MLLACFLLGCTAQKEDTGALKQEDLYSCTYKEGARFSLQVGQPVRLVDVDRTEQQVQVDVKSGSVVCSVWDDPQQDEHQDYALSLSGQVRDLYLCCEEGYFVLVCVVQQEYKDETDEEITRQTIFLSCKTGEMQTMDGVFLPEQEQLGVTFGTNLGISTSAHVKVGKNGTFTTESQSREQGIYDYVTNCPLVILAGDERDHLTGDDFISADAVYCVIPAGARVNVQSAETVVLGDLYSGTQSPAAATAYFVSSDSSGEYAGYMLADEDGKLLLQGRSVRQALTTGYSQQLVRRDSAMAGYTEIALMDETLLDEASGVMLSYSGMGLAMPELVQSDDRDAGLYAEAPEGTQSVRVEYLYMQGSRWEVFGITWKDGDGQETSVFYTPFMGELVPMRLCELTGEGLMVPLDEEVTLPEEPVISQGYLGLLQGDYLGQYTRIGANLLVRVQ